MKKFIVQLERELKGFFYSPIAYVVICFLLFTTGFDFWIIVNAMNRTPGYSTVVEGFFQLLPWFGFIFVFPLLTMRLFAEEFKMGTIEPLATSPITDLQIVLAKYFASLMFYMLIWVPSLFYFLIFQYITKENASTAVGAIWSSYLILLLMGMFYLSIGCFASVLTRNQIIAAVVSFCLIVVVFFFGVLAAVVQTGTATFRDLMSYISAFEHLGDFSRGIIDSRPIVYYLSMTGFMLFLTFQVFQFRKWRA